MTIQILIPANTATATSKTFSANANNTCSICALGLTAAETVKVQLVQRINPADKTAGVRVKDIITLTADVPYTDNFNSNLTLQVVKSVTANPVWVQITSITGFAQFDNVV